MVSMKPGYYLGMPIIILTDLNVKWQMLLIYRDFLCLLRDH